MDTQKILNEIKQKYPGKKIILDPQDNPSEIICEIDPTEDHPESSIALSVVGRSQPHFHRISTEIYEVIKGELTIIKDGEIFVLHVGEKLTIKPGEVHNATGDEVWFLTHSTPGWKFEDHIIKE